MCIVCAWKVDFVPKGREWRNYIENLELVLYLICLGFSSQPYFSGVRPVLVRTSNFTSGHDKYEGRQKPSNGQQTMIWFRAKDSRRPLTTLTDSAIPNDEQSHNHQSAARLQVSSKASKK